MVNPKTDDAIGRRQFLQGAAAVALGAATGTLGDAVTQPAQTQPAPAPLIGIQVGAVSFADEGVEPVLDILQEKAAVNTLFLATFTYGRGIAGRQVPGQPFPDHGVQSTDQATFHGGNYATPHPQFYSKTAIQPEKAPDLGDNDVLQAVIPAARKRGMKVYCWYEDSFRKGLPGIEGAREIELSGAKAATLCPLNPDYRQFLTGLTKDYCSSYDIDGIMWGSERQGPFNHLISHGPAPLASTCFCDLHRQAARDRGIDVGRALAGYHQLADFASAAYAGKRPTDGYFVTFWRLLLQYPELLAWEKLWTDSKHAVYGDVYRAAKAVKPGVKVGFHIWHENSFSPFFRAEQDYPAFAKVADYLKIVVYNNCGGPRYARAIDALAQTIFRDVPRDQLLELHSHWLNYNEKGYADLPTAGLSSDYVARETRRAVDDVNGTCAIYPGIDIDVPTNKGEKKTHPEDVYAATLAGLKTGAQGVILSRKYSEMTLANLAAAGKAVRDAWTL